MVRKSERVIGTLMIWIAVPIAMLAALDRLNIVRVHMQNAWYHSTGVVTGAISPEEGIQLMNELQQVNNDLYFQVQQFAGAEMFNYLPYLLLICAILLVGAIVSTMLIWRSVVVPEAMRQAIAAAEEDAEETAADHTSLASLLNDEGELLDPDTDFQPVRKYEQGSS